MSKKTVLAAVAASTLTAAIAYGLIKKRARTSNPHGNQNTASPRHITP